MDTKKILKQHMSRLKTVIVLSVMFFCVHLNGRAQNETIARPALVGGNYNIAVGRVPMSEGVKDGVTAEIPEVSPETAREAWGKYIKSYGGKTKGRKGELTTSNADFFGQRINIYALFTPSAIGTRVTVFLQNPETKDFLLLTEDQEQYEKVFNMLQQYAPTAQTAGVNNQRKKQEKLLRALEGDYSRLEKNTQHLRKDIVEYKNKISKAEAQIHQNEAEMERKNDEINRQKQTIDYVKEKLNKVPR